jgi:hypothetical protein
MGNFVMPENSHRKSTLPARLSSLSASYAIGIPIALAIALETYAEDHHIRPETAIVEALRSYIGER